MKSIFEPITVALTQLRSSKLRSFLSLLGILIAVGAVTGIVSIGEGLQAVIVKEFDNIGGFTSIWSWEPNSWYKNKSGKWVRRNWEEHITQNDIDAIMAETDKVEFIMPNRWVPLNNSQMQYRGAIASVRALISTSPVFAYMENWIVEKGRFLDYLDMRDASKVVVLGYQIAYDLFGPGVDPIGKEVKLDGRRYTVIGVMQHKKFFDNDYDNRVVMPLTTAQKRIIGHDYLGYIKVKVKHPHDVPEVVDTMKRVYKRLHAHGDEFNIRTGEAAMEEISRVLLIMKIVAGGIAGISLLVGGIGIMNIMLVSVAERTREVGIRMALGAKRSDILRQFIIEAIVLCLVGGLCGILFGIGIGQIISAYITGLTKTDFPSVMSPMLMGIAVGFSLSVGLVFGVYPAWRASKLDPVEALRYE